MKKFWKIFGITTFAQMIMWLLLIAYDYIMENFSRYNKLEMTFFLSILIFPIIFSIIYIISDKNEIQKIKRFIIIAALWLVETAGISNYVIELINNGKWFIMQGFEGSGEGGVPAMDLNGIEYGILPMYWGIVPIIIVLSWKLISFIYIKIKAIVKSKSIGGNI